MANPNLLNTTTHTGKALARCFSSITASPQLGRPPLLTAPWSILSTTTSLISPRIYLTQLNAALDFRQTALKHPVAWTGAELHSLSGLKLCEYLVECGLSKCQAREVARDVMSAREITKITEMKQTMIEQAHDTYTKDFKVCDTIRMSSILACLFMIVVATSVGLIH
ncbi:hypothetical protein RB213_013830 [Colletotrichum asianum]